MSQRRKTDDRIKSKKQFVHWADELTDSDAVRAVELVAQLQTKYANKPNTKENLEELRDEALTRLADINILAEFDPAPCFYGEPPILEFKGKISTDDIHTYGFDHEKKGWEINKAHDRGEDFLGEKEKVKKPKKDS